jgi:hypothetical protein
MMRPPSGDGFEQGVEAAERDHAAQRSLGPSRAKPMPAAAAVARALASTCRQARPARSTAAPSMRSGVPWVIRASSAACSGSAAAVSSTEGSE